MIPVVIVDYGMGNVRSVKNAFGALGIAAHISRAPADLAEAARIVLPGVGAFGEAMTRLRSLELVPALTTQVMERKKPFLGICLGMQLLAQRSFEHGENEGLAFISGEVRRLQPEPATLRVPHIGWNAVTAGDCPLFAKLGAEPAFYFVHSFQFVPAERARVAATCDYGGEVVAAVQQGNLFGTQFHPEKSHQTGLALLKNFLAWERPC